MNEYQFDIRKADAAYKAFPSFKKWENIDIDTVRWDRYVERIKSVSSASPQVLEHAQKIVRRYAAIETGAIEKLYDVDRGFTWTVAVEMAEMQLLLSQRSKNTSNLIEAQLNGYDSILDIATGQRKLTEAWIRELHHVICNSQKTYSVITPQGPQERPLPLGDYKRHPNHVIQANGDVHSHAPVDMVGAEMHRLMEELASSSFESIHPILQAAFSHYAIVNIHPFSDGNGRVARALASVFLYRAVSIPFLVLAEDRDEYFDALETADNGNFQQIINFTMERSFTAIDLVELSIKAGARKDVSKSLEELSAFYITKGGFRHEEVDSAANVLLNLCEKLLTIEFSKIKDHPNLELANIQKSGHTYRPYSKDYRLFLSGHGIILTLDITSMQPAHAGVSTTLQIHIPKDCGINDDFIIKNTNTKEIISARINEILPSVKSGLEIKLKIFAESTINELVDRLYNEARKVYKT